MANKCVALRCDFNYDSERENRQLQPKHERLSLFEFPKHNVDAERRRKWILRVPRMIGNQVKNNLSSFAKNHCRTEDIISENTDSNNQRKRKKKLSQLHNKRYSKTAIPCIWPGAPSYLTNAAPCRTTSCTTSESRDANAQRHLEKVEKQ